MLLSNLIIINYHKIEEKRDFGITTRKPKDFCDDLDYLNNNGYKSITFSDIAQKDKLPENPVIITFDDAYYSFYEQAFKRLLEREMKAVVYVPVNFIGKSNNWDVQLFGLEYLHMDKSQLLEISQNGIEIGSHTLQHRFLNSMRDDQLIKELKESKSHLEVITGKPVLSISYPFGRFNKRILHEAGKHYEFGVQQTHKPCMENGLFNLSLQRINIYRTDTHKTFEEKLKFHTNRKVRLKSRIVQTGSWATIIQQSLKRW